jgi:Plavaka transposase
VESKIPLAAKLLALIIYSDATTLDTYGHSSSHPIYLSLANIPMKRRTKYEAKAFIGLFKQVQKVKRNLISFDYFCEKHFKIA